MDTQIYTSLSDGAALALSVIGLLMAVGCVVSLVVSVVLAISYIKYNRRQNSVGLTGEQIARGLLDENGLQHINVTCAGSLMFGNSYSHYFQKVRLRRRTWLKDSVASLAMAAQKSSLAILDAQGDPDMVMRVRLTPFIYMGPFAIIPLVILGALIDTFILKTTNGTCAAIGAGFGLLTFLAAFVMSALQLRTERRAQKLALESMQTYHLADEEELEMCKKLYTLYNIEYINNMVMAFFELVYRVLQLVFRSEKHSFLWK